MQPGSSVSRWLLGSALMAAALLALAGDAHAGDRKLELIFVNMTPDAESGGDSSECVKAVHKVFTDGYTVVKKLGETKTRAATGVPKGGAHFLSWTGAQFKTLKEGSGQEYFDSVVLVDCRPEKQLLDILVVDASNDTVAITLHRVAPTKAILKIVGERAMARAWGGFVP